MLCLGQQLHGIYRNRDEVAQEAAEHVEEAELPSPELLLHAETDAHLEEEIEEDVQSIGLLARRISKYICKQLGKSCLGVAR